MDKLIKKRLDSRVHFKKLNKLNTWGYTISPAPKSYERNEIESLYEAIKYYKNEGITELSLQVKYMGSYCSAYIHRNIEESKFFSRNGYIINHLDREKLIESIRHIHEKEFSEEKESINRLEMIVVEGELLPWRALGGGLIDKEYSNYYELNNNLLNYRIESKIEDKVNEVINSDKFKRFKEIYTSENDEEVKLLRDEFKEHEIRQYKSLLLLNSIFLSSKIEDERYSLDLFKKQLDIFGHDSPKLEFKHFNVVKLIFSNGQEILSRTNSSAFLMFGNEEDQLVLNISSDNEEDYIPKAYEFFNKVSSQEREGIMVKPIMSSIINLVPCFKVRTNNYLQLIYGHKFNQNLDYYMEKRNIKMKMRQSIREYDLTCILHRKSYKNLNYNDLEYTNILYKLIDSELFNKTLDTRL